MSYAFNNPPKIAPTELEPGHGLMPKRQKPAQPDLQAEIARLTAERDDWARKAMEWRRKYAELRYPGMTNEVYALGVTATVKESLTAGAPEPQAYEHCTWMQDGEADGTWFTDCGHAFNLEAGAPAENKMKFCCYCGKPTRAPGVATDGGSNAAS